MKKLNLLIIFLLGLSIFSCSTENLTDDDPNGGNNGNVTTGKYLKKMTWDNGVSTELTYNQDYYLQRATTGSSERLYFYDGSNRLIREEVISNSDGTSTFEETQYFYENGKLARSLNYEGNIYCCETVFTILDDKMVSLIQYNSNGIESFRKSFFYDQYGNVTSITYDYNESQETRPDQTVSITYDDKNNFSWILPKFSGYHYRPISVDGFQSDRNNPISIVSVNESDGAILYESQNSYTYDMEGFPTTMTFVTDDVTRTITFEYY